MNLKDAFGTLQLIKKKQIYHQLYTKWGEELDSNHVLEEYPRPQLRRDNYTILNGYWNYTITKKHSKPNNYNGKILVPFSPESVLSGVNKQLQPDEFLWYERTVWINKKLEGKRCILHFGAVDRYCKVFVNEKELLEHMGGYLPFSIDITKEIKEKENLLTLKVMDRSDESYHSRGKQKLKRGGMFYTAQSGIWQTVWMEWVPEMYIKTLKITPCVEKSVVQVELQMNYANYNSETKKETYKDTKDNKIDNSKEYRNENKKEETQSEIQENINIDIYANSKLIQTVKSHLPSITISMKEFTYWSPEHPFLYDMVITVGNDKVESYFAMRKYEIKKDKDGIPRIYLNNELYFQNGVLDQGYWPDGLYTAPSDEAFIYDIQKVKELGFNMIRKHIKIEPLRWYYHCDRLGVIVWQDMVNGGEKYNTFLVGYLPTLFPKLIEHFKDKHYALLSRKNITGREEWITECKETVEHLYNCPCIAVWVPFNEGWGQFDAGNAVKLIRDMDKTRLIDQASGWFDQQGGDFKSIHNYFRILEVVPEKRATVLSEFGGYACYSADHSYSWTIYGYRIFITNDDLNHAYQKLFQNEIAKLIQKGLSAAVYTQLADVEDEVNGLLTYDRKVCKVTKVSILAKPSE